MQGEVPQRLQNIAEVQSLFELTRLGLKDYGKENPPAAGASPSGRCSLSEEKGGISKRQTIRVQGLYPVTHSRTGKALLLVLPLGVSNAGLRPQTFADCLLCVRAVGHTDVILYCIP